MAQRRSGNVHRDSVYRAIFQLEAGKIGASKALCDSLQRAWLNEQMRTNPEFQEWLHKVTPMCLALISSSGESSGSLFARIQFAATPAKQERGSIMQIHVEQVRGVRFSIKARDHVIVSDQPQDNGGNDTGMTPPELLLASLGSCAAFYAAEYLRSRKLAEDGVSVSVSAEKLTGPARLGNFQIRVKSPVVLTDEQKDAMARSVEHCLVKNTLLNPPAIEVALDVPVEASASTS
jgi:putative redox protein